MEIAERCLKRRVYVNGCYFESMAAGARRASEITGREVYLWEIQRCLKKSVSIEGVEISETPPEPKGASAESRQSSPGKKSGVPLLRYPPGEHPLDKGLPHIWR